MTATRRAHAVMDRAMRNAFPQGIPNRTVVETRGLRHENDGSRFGIGWVALGSHADFGSAGDAAWIDAEAEGMPEAVIATLAGRRATDLIDHPWLEGVVIEETQRTSTGLRVSISNPSSH